MKLSWLSLLLFVLISAIAACSPGPKSPAVTKVQAAELLSSKTVALVQDDEENGVQAYCTGVWVSETSILTASHCTQGETTFLYVTEGDVFGNRGHMPRLEISTRSASLSARDARHDLALLRVDEPPPVHGVATLTSSEVIRGEPAQQVGQTLRLWWSYSSGDVAAIRWVDAGSGPMFWVQTTTPSSPGNSGGGLFNDRAELIGICHGGRRDGQLVNIFVHPVYIESFLKNSPH